MDETSVSVGRAPAFPITPPRPGRTGRPTKLTPEVEARILQSVREGAFFEPAAIAAGVSREAMREWVIRGQSDTHLGRKTIFRHFVDALALAQAENETRLTATLSKGGEGKYPDWRAQAFVLERRYPQRWAPPKAETAAGITLALSNEQLQMLGEALRVATAQSVNSVDVSTESIEVIDDPQSKP